MSESDLTRTSEFCCTTNPGALILGEFRIREAGLGRSRTSLSHFTYIL